MDGSVQKYMEENFIGRRLLRETQRGSVWLASDRVGRPVIIKNIHAKGLPYRKLKEISVPLCPAIRFVSEDETDTWVVEEYVSGENLRDFLEDGKYLTEKETRTVLLQMAEGLSVLHKAGIIHRDIKPSNLIWQGKQVWLVDFDAAREMRPDDNPDTRILGTAGYAPPEQYGFGQTDARSDIYALGKTLDELLDPSVKGGIRKILRRATAFDPKDRYSSAKALQNAVYFEKFKKWILFGGAIVTAILCWVISNPSQRNDTSNAVNEQIPVQSENHEPMNADKDDIPRSEPVTASNTPQGNETIIGGSDNANLQAPVEADIPQPFSNPSNEVTRERTPKRKIIVSRKVEAALLINGKPHGSETLVVPYDEWKSWNEVERRNYYSRTMALPQNWTVGLLVENASSEVVRNARMEMSIGNSAPMTVYAKNTALAPGGTTIISAPLTGYLVKSRSLERVSILFRMDNDIDDADAHKYYWDSHIYLESPPQMTR